MTLEEYLGHLNDRLMLEISNMSEMPEMYDWVVFQIVEKAIQLMKNDYVLVHKSHITGRCEFDEVFNQHLVQTGVTAVVTSWVGQDEVDLAWGRLDVLAHERDKQHREVIKYLEAPKPEQTQPDPS